MIHVYMNKFHKIFVYIIVLTALIIVGCVKSTDIPEVDPTPTHISVPPSLTPSPTITPTPEPTATPECDLDQTLIALRQAIQYNEFVVLQNDIEGYSTLSIWFVDPNLDPYISDDSIPEQVALAIHDAVNVSHKLRNATQCSEVLFDGINPIVVDTNYTGWFSGRIAPDLIPTTETLTDEEIISLTGQFEIVYMRTAPVQSYPPAPCSWSTARDRIWKHFSRERENVGFYYVVDEVGQNIWAQWDGPADTVGIALNLGNIMLESECLPPQANIIITIVNEEGDALLVGFVPQLDMGALKVIYTR